MLEAMGAKMLYWSSTQSNAELEALISTSDIRVAASAADAADAEHTRREKEKRAAILINTALRGLVNEHFLVEALETGHLAAAGLDVFARRISPGLRRRRWTQPRSSTG
jgi:lactate dehydrogenase-like 2-hydroxyacid dehydrogenase